MIEEIKVTKTYKVMGGEFSFMSFPQNFHTRKEVENLFNKAYVEVKRIEEKFTDFHPSPFNNINHLAGIKPCIVDDEIFSLIEKSIEISEESQGRFDISFASVGHKWRRKQNQSSLLNDFDRTQLKELIDYTQIKFDKKNKSIFLPHRDMRIGLGGIGKGYAVDMAFNILRNAGLYNFFVNGSGDIRVHSDVRAPRMWKIGIKNPLSKDNSKSVGIIQLANGALATSGSYVHKVENPDELLDHHILNPQTGRSVDDIISSSIMGSTCLESDTTATIIMNMKAIEAVHYMNSKHIFGVVIDKTGKSFLSEKALKCFGY